ncbi:MAG: hypothetical protein L5655_04370 [Thermosediminibacteraceae bacterium]|nr:hypothetical protein [Thermosediminibacteraceae bacterium]
MDKMKMFPYLLVLILAFYGLPLLGSDTGFFMGSLLFVTPAICFLTSLAFTIKNNFTWYFPIIVAILFVPTVFIFYNSTASIYIVFYTVISIAGCFAGYALLGWKVKNNVKALIAHFIIVGVCAILLMIFVATAPLLGKYISHIAIRVPLAVMLILSYVYVGTLLDTKVDKKYDFLAGSLIAVIGLGLWLYTYLTTGKILVNFPDELRESWIPFNFYYAPFTMIYFLLGIPMQPLLGLFTNFIPSLLMGIGLSYKRSKMRNPM